MNYKKTFMESFKREIFEQLGNLFYALAADQEVSLMESGELKMLLRQDWLTEPESRPQDKISEASHLIGLSIDVLQNEKVPAEKAYKDFEKFYVKHREQFSFALKQKILETADAIVKIFTTSEGKNPRMEELTRLFEVSREPAK
jgi:hypothetical protein